MSDKGYSHCFAKAVADPATLNGADPIAVSDVVTASYIPGGAEGIFFVTDIRVMTTFSMGPQQHIVQVDR